MSPSDEITYISQNLEKILKSQYGAVGKGLGEMVRSVESQLPEETVQKIRTLARWRNKVAHDDMSFANKKIEAFRQIAWEVCFSLMNSQRGMGSQTVTTFRNWTSRQENTGNPSQIGGTGVASRGTSRQGNTGNPSPIPSPSSNSNDDVPGCLFIIFLILFIWFFVFKGC